MGIAYSPKIVTDGLVLCLDAANVKSYPGTGTTWFDLSGNGNNGTLINGPVYSSADGGSIDFDGTNDYVLGGSNLPISGNPAFTISYWAIWDGATFSTNFPSGVGNNATGVTNRGLSTTWSSGRIALDFWSVRYRAATTLNVQQWYYVSFVKVPGPISSTTLYVNGLSVSGAVEGTNSTPDIISSPYVVGRLDATRWFNGRVSDAKIYNRALSADEVKTNFNALRGRYGI